MAQAALTEFPNDPEFRFARAMSVGARFVMTVDGGPRIGAPPPDVMIIASFPNPPPATGAVGTAVVAKAVATEFAALSGAESVGIDAETRLGYLRWATGDDAGAIDAWTSVTNRATTADEDYLADFLLGWAALQRTVEEAARVAINHALAVRPKSQSAALVLAALDMRNGDGDSAHETIVNSVTKRPTDDDPWRLFLYGRHPKMSE